MTGVLAFGVVAAIAGYVWTAFEFPFAILLPAFVGWYAVTRLHYDNRKSLITGLVGGVSFTALFMLGVFFALTDGSPIALTAWASAALAAAAAGALTGAVLGKSKGALTLAVFSAAGMLVATIAAGLMRTVAPASVDVAGLAQSLYFAATMGIIGALVGGFIGAGVSWFKDHGSLLGSGSKIVPKQPHAV
jgi:hypothetical protein